MKATLLLGAILLMSLVMANDKDNSSPEGKAKAPDENKPAETGSKQNATKNTGIMVSGAPVFFLLPLMWMTVHHLHM